MSNDSETYESSAEKDLEEQLTFFPAGSRVNHTVLPGSEKANMMTVLSGQKCLELFKKSGRLGSLVRTLVGSSRWVSNKVVLIWSARELQDIFGYTEWRNFLKVIEKAKTACTKVGESVPDHFVEINKMVDLGSGAKREIDDLALTRYACYLVAQNGDSAKAEVAFAQTYFAVQTRKQEIEVATRLCRVDDGVSGGLDRVARLKGLGNAIVPQIAFEIFKAIEYAIQR